jgi:hypothetical protein
MTTIKTVYFLGISMVATKKETLFHVKRQYYKGMTLDDIEGLQEQATIYMTVVPETVTHDDIDTLSLLEYAILPDEIK